MSSDPIEVAYIQNEVQPTANTDILAVDIEPINIPCTFKIQILMSNAGNFSAQIWNGADAQVGILGVLTAGTIHIFDLLVHLGDEINFRYSVTGGTIQILRVQEIF